MKKRIMSLLLVLMMAFVLTAQAEEGVAEKIENALYRIVLRTEEGDQTLGSAVLFMRQNVLMTAESCCVEGDLYAVGAEGEHQILVWETAKDSGVALMEMVTPSTAEPLFFARTDTQTLPFLFGTNEEGTIGSVPLYQARRTVYRGQDAVIFSGEEGLLPGGVAVDVNGGVIGLVLAQQAEGAGMYIALDPDSIVAAMIDSTGADQFYDVSLSWEGGYLCAAWEDETRTGGTYAITVTGDDNHYYTIFGENADERTSQFIVPPGHAYHVQVQWVEEGKEALEPVWSAMTSFEVKESVLTDYGFRQNCYLSSAPAGQEVSSRLPELEQITTGMIADDANEMYLQIECSYDVEEVIELPMAVELAAPDGQFYFSAIGVILDPDYEQSDVFAISVQDMFADCAVFSGGKIQPGKYTLSYFIGGQYAGEYTFMLEEGAAPAGRVETSGFIADIEVTEEPGCVTVSWADAEIPEGAKVMVFSLFEGNTYYTYRDMMPDATETMFFTVPGRTMSVWAVWSTEETPQHRIPQRSGDYFVSIDAVPKTPFTAYSFTNLHTSVVSSADATAAERTELLPVAPITREALADPDTFLYFQTHDTYQVSATSEDHPLALILVTPEGLCFVEYGYFIFDVTLQESDQWLRDISGLFDSYASYAGSKAWPAGEYRILYCIDGQIAGEYTFTLE